MLHSRFLVHLGTNFIYMWSKQDQQNRVLSSFFWLSFFWKVPLVVFTGNKQQQKKKTLSAFLLVCR